MKTTLGIVIAATTILAGVGASPVYASSLQQTGPNDIVVTNAEQQNPELSISVDNIAFLNQISDKIAYSPEQGAFVTSPTLSTMSDSERDILETYLTHINNWLASSPFSTGLNVTQSESTLARSTKFHKGVTKVTKRGAYTTTYISKSDLTNGLKYGIGATGVLMPGGKIDFTAVKFALYTAGYFTSAPGGIKIKTMLVKNKVTLVSWGWQ
ncbi:MULTISPECIES: hypothetical protein [Levilactobacillus]|uniref:hypothetical protein n=1 Tax=Levilactobacillus TaxID=2767886 RepID=UPI003757D53A